MRGVHPENHETVARAVDLAVAAGERWEIALTYFLEPPEAADVLLAVSRLADVEARPWGGYPNAERVRMRLGRPEVLDAEGDEPKGVTLLDVAGNFMFDGATHRDFLGSMMGTGIERNRVGDILVQGERGAHVLTTPEMARARVMDIAAACVLTCARYPFSAGKLSVDRAHVGAQHQDNSHARAAVPAARADGAVGHHPHGGGVAAAGRGSVSGLPRVAWQDGGGD